MADDTQRLVVSLEAKIDQFQKALDKATGVADSRMTRIQKRFSAGSDQITRGLSRIGSQALTANQVNEKLIAGMSQGAKAASAFGEASTEAGHAVKGISSQSQAAFHSIRSVAEQLALGVPITQALTGQLNHLTYAASGPGGLKGAFAGVLRIFAGMFTPFRLAIAGIAGIGAAAIASAVSFANSQTKISLALTGVGKMAGATVGQINEIADAVSSTGDLSTSEAKEIATAIASTGKASAEATEKATALAHAYSLVFDKDLAETAKDLAAAVSDPGRAIDSLNARLGAWSAKQVELIKNLSAAGRTQKAAQVIIDGLEKSIGDAAAQTNFWSQAWHGLANAVSNASTATGKFIVKNTVGLSQEAQLTEDLAAARERLAQLQQGHFNLLGGVSFGTPAELKAASDEVRRLQAQLDSLRKASEDTRKAVDVSNLITGIDPTVQKLKDLQNTIDRIKSVPVGSLDEASQGVIDNVLASLQSQHDLLKRNIDLSREKYGVTLAQAEAEQQAAKIELDGIKARTPAQKAEIAYLQTRNALLNEGKSPQEAEIGAQIARTKSLTQAQHDLSEAQRDRIYQASQAVEQQQLENQTIGLGVAAATTLTQRFQLLAAAKAEAQKNGTVVSPEELAAMDQAAIALGKLAQANAALNVQKNAAFDISQLGRSQSEQNVYATLQNAGLLDNGEIVSAQAKQTAEILRTKEALSQLADIEKGFASDFLHDLIQGKSAAEALGDALTNVANKLLDIGLDKLISASLGGGTGGGLASLFGFADGGVFVPGKGPQKLKTYAGGGVSNTAAIFGEAGPEAAIPLKGGKVPVDLRMPVASPSAASAPSINITINAPNATPEAEDKINTQTLPQLNRIIDERVNYNLTRKASVRKVVRGT